MTQGIVFDIKKYSIHDGPGVRTTIFLKGCPLSCWWCHNPESQSTLPEIIFRPARCIGCGECVKACPKEAISATAKGLKTDLFLCDRCGICADVCPAEAREMTGRTMSVEEVMKEIRKDIIFYDESGGGVTFSGGEPLIQPKFLIELLQACGREEIHRTVDTTGFTSAETILKVAEHTDLFLYDLKHMDPEEHKKYTGVSNEIILKNLRLLAEKGAGLNIRFPVIPGVNDDEGNIRHTADFVRSLPGNQKMNILPYHKAGIDKYDKLGMSYQLEDTEEPSGERMDDIKKELEQFGLEVKIGG